MQSSDPDIPVLGPALLGALEDRWRSHRIPLIERLQPGVSAEEIDEVTSRIGVRLPVEARQWWQRHNGVAARDIRYSRERIFAGPGFEYLPLAEAVERYRSLRRLAVEAAHDQVSNGLTEAEWWNPAWFPITVAANGRVIACDCSVSEGLPTPIRSIKWGQDESWQEPRAASFGQVVCWWLEAFDAGAYGYDAANGAWTYRYELLDAGRELTRVV
jgi:cell wall assembly regulator SMI1